MILMEIKLLIQYKVASYWKIFAVASPLQDPSTYVKMLGRTNEFTSTIAADNMDTMEKYLEAFNAFKEHDKAKLKIIRDVEEAK